MNLYSQPIEPLLPLQNRTDFNYRNSLQPNQTSKSNITSQMAGDAIINNTYISHLPSSPSTQSLSPLNHINPVSGVHLHSDSEIQKVSKDFESLFLQMLLKEMRNSVQKSGLLGNSQAYGFFESMHDEQLSTQLASVGGIGISHMLYERLKGATEIHQKIFS